jgi:hypothetical protein
VGLHRRLSSRVSEIAVKLIVGTVAIVRIDFSEQRAPGARADNAIFDEPIVMLEQPRCLIGQRTEHAIGIKPVERCCRSRTTSPPVAWELHVC